MLVAVATGNLPVAEAEAGLAPGRVASAAAGGGRARVLIRLVLVGGGHAHLHVLADLAARPLPGVEVTLVSPSAWHHYSGMVPGFLQGGYAEADLTIDLAALAARAGARLLEATAERIDVGGRTVDAGGTRLPFDILSLDVGAAPAGLDVPGVREHAVTVRPMRQAVALRARIDALATPARRGPVRVTVVGAGAGGVEVALALHRRIRAAGSRPEVSLVEAASDVLPDYAAPVRRRAARDPRPARRRGHAGHAR